MALSEILSPVKIVRHLREDGSAATLNRLLGSRHVADLRLIVSLTLYAVAFCFVFAVFFEAARIIWDATPADPARPHSVRSWMALASDAIVDSGPFVSVVFAIGCGVMGWAYQSGSARLGVVDLFACEITTLCRVFTIVDLARRYVDAFNADLGNRRAPDPELIERIRHPFDHEPSNETYTPVFDQNASDLRALDANVVTNVTAFYTYLKAMKDALRNLSRIPAPTTGGKPHDAWHEGLATVLYMQFLMLESARKAVRDLIEFEPNQVENTVTILISELCAYRFLLHQFDTGHAGAALANHADAPPLAAVENANAGGEDFRHARLRIRRASYRCIVGQAWWRAKEGERYWTAQEASAEADVARQIAASGGSRADVSHRRVERLTEAHRRIQQWRKAAETANELANRYATLFPGEPIDRPTDLPPQPQDAARTAAHRGVLHRPRRRLRHVGVE